MKILSFICVWLAFLLSSACAVYSYYEYKREFLEITIFEPNPVKETLKEQMYHKAMNDGIAGIMRGSDFRFFSIVAFSGLSILVFPVVVYTGIQIIRDTKNLPCQVTESA